MEFWTFITLFVVVVQAAVVPNLFPPKLVPGNLLGMKYCLISSTRTNQAELCHLICSIPA